MMKNSVYVKMAAVLFIVFVITGCGNKTQESQDSNVKKVIVAVENGSRPLSYIDEDGNLSGYEVDLLAAVDELIPDYQFEVEAVEEDATQIGLESGKYVLIGGGLYKTPEREEKYLLPDAIAGVSTIKIFVRSDDTEIKNLDDLVGKKITPVAPNGGIYNLLTEYNEEHPDAKLEIEIADGGFTNADKLVDINEGRYDAMVVPDNLGMFETIEELGLSIKTVEDPVKVNGTYFVLAKDQEDLRDKVNDALVKLRKDGTLSELNLKWFKEDKIAYYED